MGTRLRHASGLGPRTVTSAAGWRAARVGARLSRPVRSARTSAREPQIIDLVEGPRADVEQCSESAPDGGWQSAHDLRKGGLRFSSPSSQAAYETTSRTTRSAALLSLTRWDGAYRNEGPRDGHPWDLRCSSFCSRTALRGRSWSVVAVAEEELRSGRRGVEVLDGLVAER